LSKVIIVDDEKMVRKIIARIIIEIGLAKEEDICLLSSSDNAWEFISRLSEKPRIVFSSVDMNGAGKNGLDLLAAVKEKFSDVVFVSMSGTHSYAGEAKRRGADCFLPKPFSVEDIKTIFAENIPKE
jgi:YesN/AraC family two-component response regulator